MSFTELDSSCRYHIGSIMVAIVQHELEEQHIAAMLLPVCSDTWQEGYLAWKHREMT